MADSRMMEKHLFNLKLASKEMSRNAKQCDKGERTDKDKCKKAIKQGNLECARIHAENAIRKRNQSTNFLRMSAQLDAVANRVQNAVNMRRVTASMAGVAKSMDVALKSMNIEQISVLMDKFDQQCDNLDVGSATMDSAMAQTITTSIPLEQVDGLMSQIAGEAGLELRLQLPDEQTSKVGASTQISLDRKELSNRLSELRKD